MTTDETGMSHDQAAASLAAARAAELDVLVDTRPNPAWVWPSIGAAAAVFIASFDLVGGTAWVALTTLAYSAAIGVIVGTLQRQRGTQPKLGRLPAELRRQIMVFALLGGLATAVGVLLVTLAFDEPPRFTVMGLLLGTVTIVAGRWADGRYIAAAERIRAEHGA